MPVTGRYIAQRFRRGVATHLATYATTVRDELLPVFANLNSRAGQVAKEEFDRLQSLPSAGESDGDIGSIAETAQEAGEVYYNALDTLHKTSLTLYTVGLFHLLEQQLAVSCRDGSFGVKPPSDTKLEILVAWYDKNFGLNLKALPSWGSIDELRLLANSAKHGEGSSADQLRLLRPDLFEDPRLRELMPEHPEIYTPARIHVPLAGQGIYVSEDEFASFSSSTFQFVIEIAKYFEARANERFFTAG